VVQFPQHLVGRPVAARYGGPVDGRIVHGDLVVIGQRLIIVLPCDPVSVGFRVGSDQFESEYPENIPHGLVGQKQVVIGIHALFFETPGDAGYPRVERCRRQRPTAETGFRIRQILAGGFGRPFDMVTFVDAAGHEQSGRFGIRRHQLPQSGGPGSGTDIRIQSAFGHAEVFEIVRDTVFFQDRFDHRKVARRRQQRLRRPRVQVHRRQHFAQQALTGIVISERHRLAGKIQFAGKRRNDDRSARIGRRRHQRRLGASRDGNRQQERTDNVFHRCSISD